MTMTKFLTPLAAVLLLAGCAETPVVVNTYSYDSEIHDGNVLVHDLSYGSSDQCPKDWREVEQAFRNGLPPLYGMTLKITVTAPGPDGTPVELPMLVSTGKDDKITVKDFQVDKSLLLNAETNGLVKQGELFTYPEGYFIRAAKPKVVANEFSLCIGVDRMYIPADSIASGGRPQIHLDRLNILYEGERDDETLYTFGTDQNIQVKVAVHPK